MLRTDDGDRNQVILVDVFAGDGCRNFYASAGCEAIELARQERPHSTLLDYNVPLVNGNDASRAIKEDVPESTATFDMHENYRNLADKALKFGARIHISKMIDFIYLQKYMGFAG